MTKASLQSPLEIFSVETADSLCLWLPQPAPKKLPRIHGATWRGRGEHGDTEHGGSRDRRAKPGRRRTAGAIGRPGPRSQNLPGNGSSSDHQRTEPPGPGAKAQINNTRLHCDRAHLHRDRGDTALGAQALGASGSGAKANGAKALDAFARALKPSPQFFTPASSVTAACFRHYPKIQVTHD